MTADDVKFSFERIIHGDKNGKQYGYAVDFEALKEVQVTGKYTGKLILKHPSAAIWPIAIADGTGCILSRKAVEELGDKIATTVIGSGPMMLKEWVQKDHYTLVANPDYKGPYKAALKEVTVKLIPEQKTAFLAYQTKELDFTALDIEQIDTAKALPDTNVIDIPSIDYNLVAINMENGALADLRVRQAIRLAIDVDAIVQAAYAGAVKRGYSLMAPGLIGYWKDAPVYNRDVAKAQALLAEAGKAGLTFSFTCPNDSLAVTVAQIVQANLAEVGITLNINAMDTSAFWSYVIGDTAKQLELTWMAYTSKSDPSFQTQWFISSQIDQWNWVRMKNPEFDKLHQQGLETLDPEKRQEIYVRMQQILDETSAFVWITHGRNLYVSASTLKPAIRPNGKNWQFEFFAGA